MTAELPRQAYLHQPPPLSTAPHHASAIADLQHDSRASRRDIGVKPNDRTNQDARLCDAPPFLLSASPQLPVILVLARATAILQVLGIHFSG